MFLKREESLHHTWAITPIMPWYKKPSIMISLFVIVMCIICTYIYLNYALYTTNHRLKEITISYDLLTEKYNETKISKVRLQRELEISKQSQSEVKSNLLDLHQANQDLTEQLDLYKKIMSANRGSESISVENLQLRQLEDNYYLLSMVLLQASKNRNLLQGKFNIKIIGELDNVNKVLDYNEIAMKKTNSLTYKFRDFQHFNGKLNLPENFKVNSIKVELQDHKTKVNKHKTFNVTMIGRKINVAQAQNQNNRLQSST